MKAATSVRNSRASSEAGTTDNKPTSALSRESGDDGSGYVCDDIDLRVVNSCEMLRNTWVVNWAVKGWEESTLHGDGGCLKRGKKCLFQSNAQYFSCGRKHTETARLCPCKEIL